MTRINIPTWPYLGMASKYQANGERRARSGAGGKNDVIYEKASLAPIIDVLAIVVL